MGGQLTILTGNHDNWLGDFYQRTLGADIVDEPWIRTCHGIRVVAQHGHRLGARRLWKAVLESRAFLWAFASLPNPIATSLANHLEHSNQQSLEVTHQRHVAIYRSYSSSLIDRGLVDLVLLGHVHDVFDESIGSGRMIVLGDWIEGSSYVRIDESGLFFCADRITRDCGVA